MPAKLSQEVAVNRVVDLCKEIDYKFEPFVYNGFKTKLVLICNNGHRYTTCSYNNFMKGRRCPLCPTIAVNKFTQEEAESKIKVLCDKIGYKFKPFVYIGSNETKLELTCDHGHTWNSTNINTFLNYGTRCPKCSNITKKSTHLKLSDHEAITQISEICKEKEYTFEPFKFKGIALTRIKFKCKFGHEWSTVFRNIVLKGQGCPCCIGKNQKYGYITSIIKENKVIAIKYGIESSIGNRVSRQNRYSIFSVRRLKTFIFPSYEDCHKAENECCNIFQSENMEKYNRLGLMNKFEFKDGHTETTHIKNIDLIELIYKKYGGIEID